MLTAFPTLSYAQQNEADTSAVKDYSLAGFPFVFYLPETRLGFGGLGSYTFRFKGEPKSSISSQVQLGFAYTLRKQMLFYIPFRLHLKNDHLRSYGEVGYYRYLYDFYGIGNDAVGEETFSANFPRVRINVLKKVGSNLFAGFRYWMDDYNITERDPNGLLENESITGSKGGLFSGAGLILNYDKRDQPYASESGFYAEYIMFRNGKRFGSDFEFSKIFLDLRYFHKNLWGHILAFQSFTEFTGGDAPFNQLALLGGTRKMRGYREGRYRENHMQLFQTEYRAHLFWRLGVVAFGSLGVVENRLVDFEVKNVRWAMGGGLRLRLTEAEKINLRIDFGFGKKTKGFYVTIGEAF